MHVPCADVVLYLHVGSMYETIILLQGVGAGEGVPPSCAKHGSFWKFLAYVNFV